MNRSLTTLLFSTVLLTSTTASAQAQSDWPHWRGPNNNGIAAAGERPVTSWSDSQNVIWKTPIPGRGHASPTLVGNKIFLSTADERTQTQSVVAFDRKTGKQLWQTPVSTGGFPKTHRKNTHATPTVACNGKQLFITCHHHARLTVTSLDINGNILWKIDAGPYNPKQYEYGYAPSPLLYGENVIISADYEKGGYLAAFNRNSGKQAWRTPRYKQLSFSSPIVANIAGRDQLLISGCERVISYNPKSGKQLWTTMGTTMATCGTMVWDGDLVFASGGYPKKETVAVKADGSGEVVWKNDQKAYEQSMLAYNGYVYIVTDGGVAICWRARDGKEMWRKRLAGPVSASPILANGNIYLSNERGTTFVFKADPNKFQLVAKNQLGDETFATLAICDNKIFTRIADSSSGKRQEYLYCIGK